MEVTRALRRLHLHATYGDDDVDDLADEIAELLHRLTGPQRQMVVRHAYWRMPSVPLRALRGAVGGDAVLRALAGRGPVTGLCRGCGRIRRALGRDEEEVAAGDCADCRVWSAPAGRGACRAHGVAARRSSTAVRFGWCLRAVA